MNMSTSQPGAEIGYTWPIRVYYEDTDAGGIVFYANYLKFFERARTEWLRACGVDQNRLAEETGAIFIVRSTAVDYRAPARLDDVVRVVCRIERLGCRSRRREPRSYDSEQDCQKHAQTAHHEIRSEIRHVARLHPEAATGSRLLRRILRMDLDQCAGRT